MKVRRFFVVVVVFMFIVVGVVFLNWYNFKKPTLLTLDGEWLACFCLDDGKPLGRATLVCRQPPSSRLALIGTYHPSHSRTTVGWLAVRVRNAPLPLFPYGVFRHPPAPPPHSLALQFTWWVLDKASHFPNHTPRAQRPGCSSNCSQKMQIILPVPRFWSQ